MGCGASSSCPAGASLDCGAAARAREERYRIEERDMQEALNPKLKQIRLAPVRIANMWRRADMDGTGDLGMEEIGMILVDVGHALTRAQLEKVMEVVDKDGQGQVSREEFTEWYKRMLDTDFAEISEQQEASRSPLHARVLAQVPVFASIAHEHHSFCEELAAHILAREFREGFNIVDQGADGHEMFFIVSGSVDVCIAAKVDESNPTGAVDTMGPGDQLGQGALFTTEPRTATIRCTTPVMTLVLSRENLELVLRRYPEVQAAIDDYRNTEGDSATARRVAAHKRAQQTNAAGAAVLQQFFDGLTGSSRRQDAEAIGGPDGELSAIAAAGDAAGLHTPDVSSMLHTPQLSGSIRGLEHERSSSPLQQVLASPMTPRTEKISKDFERGVDALEESLVDLSESVSSITASFAVRAEASRSSLGSVATAASNNPTEQAREQLEEIMNSSAKKLEQEADNKLRKLEKQSLKLSETVHSVYGSEIALNGAVEKVTEWLDERGIGRSSEKADCTDAIMEQFQQMEYHPDDWVGLLETLSKDQLM
eukprot:COSAG04_NODE_1096_length_8305_cov_9.345235_8_plen_539_part_00